MKSQSMQVTKGAEMYGYGTRVKTADGGTGMIVGRTSRTYRVLLDGAGGRTNRGRHSGEGIERGYRFADVERIEKEEEQS